MKKPVSIAALAAALLMFPQAPRASLVLALDLDQLTQLADRVVVGEVLSVKSAWEPDHKHIFTNIEVQVAESWKGGTAVGKTILVQQPGGRVDDLESRVFGLAEFSPGDRAVLFLKGAERGSAVLGLGQGMRPLRFDEGARRWMAAGGDRSAAVRRDGNGHFVAAEPDPSLPLETLRTRVLRLVRP
jgi:hypothetical protein